MAIAAPAITRRRMLETLAAASAAPLAVAASQIAANAAEAASEGDQTKVEGLKRQCEFTEYRFPRYRTGRHHRLITEHLERKSREIDRLMLMLAPRHGKSELASKSFGSPMARTAMSARRSAATRWGRSPWPSLMNFPRACSAKARA
jgi:hypothetical protein